jgi:hypothetical protein
VNATVFGVKSPCLPRCFALPYILGVAGCLIAAGCTDEAADSPPADAAESLDSAADVASGKSQPAFLDAAVDTAAVDAAAVDGGVNVADAAVLDGATVDAIAANDVLSCAPLPMKLQCSPEYQHNENTSGLSIYAGAPAGWKFEVKGDCPRTLTRLGLNIRNGSETEGSIFGLVAALPANDNRPIDPTRFPASVLKTVLLPLSPYSSGSKTVSAEVSVELTPGWYEVVFGVGAYGATATSSTVHSGATGSCTDNNTHPFTIKTQEQEVILQGIGPYMFVQTN